MTNSIEAPGEREAVCANCEGMIGELAEGRDPEELCDTCYEDSQAAYALSRGDHIGEQHD